MNSEVSQFQILTAQRSYEISRIGRAGIDSSIGSIKEMRESIYLINRGCKMKKMATPFPMKETPNGSKSRGQNKCKLTAQETTGVFMKQEGE